MAKRGRKKKEEAVSEDPIQDLLSSLNKELGETSLQLLNRASKEVPSTSTGSLSLDHWVLGCGGVPHGRIVEIYGPEGGGKTTLCLHIIANAQKEGHLTAFIDAEHALNPEYAADLGVDFGKLLVCQPDSGEHAFEVIEALLGTGSVKVIVVDSVAALVPLAEQEADVGHTLPGIQARLMSMSLRRIIGKVHASGTCLIFINQVRSKIGVRFGSPETTSGGKALKFYSSVRLDIRRIGSIKQGDLIAGNRCKIKSVKNKVGSPFRTTEVDLIFGKGINSDAELIDYGLECGLIKKSGSWYSYIPKEGEPQRLGQGRSSVFSAFKESPEMAELIKKEVISYLSSGRN